MRRRGPGLVGMAVGTAVIAGTAGAVRHRQETKYAGQEQAAYAEQQAAAQEDQMAQQVAAQQAQIQALQAQQAAAAAPPAAAPAPAGLTMDQKMQQLQQLGQLKDAGILTEQEFAAQKAAILAG